MPCEVHHDREANTVLQNFTKKSLLTNVNVSNVLESKNAYLDEQDPKAQRMSNPVDTN